VPAELPEGWERVAADGPGPFVTSEVLRAPDGSLVRWHSRLHRKGRAGPRAGVWWRPDRDPAPRTLLPLRRIGPDDAWSEDPDDRNYNRPVKRANGAPGDRLRRSDHLYDIIVEIDHNARPRVARRGSAVFLHLARPGFGPTAGCVALEARRLRWLVARLGRKTVIDIR
jgi:L,D-peptidoglycan transpeptidase YkuD (ErfK/YbiS/YcfS/YnhG family)